MKITIDSEITIEGARHAQLRQLKSNLTLPNPAYEQAAKHSKYGPPNLPQVLEYYHEEDGTITIPRGAADLLDQACAGEARTTFDDTTVAPFGFRFHGTLRLYQVAALAELLRTRCSVLEAPTGSGKTVVGCAAIAERGQRTLIIVHTTVLRDQWIGACSRFLGIVPSVISGKQSAFGHSISIVIVNTLANGAVLYSPAVQEIGHVIVDECHRVAAPSYQHALRAIGA